MVTATTNPEPIISPEEASAIAEEVRLLIKAGNEETAWERVRHLHPSDIGSIVASLPRASREAMVTTMAPETLAWLLRHMNPIVAARVGTRLGAGILSTVLVRAPRRTIVETLRLLPGRKAREVAEALGQPVEPDVVVDADLETAGAFMVARFPTVGLDQRVEDARQKLRELEDLAQGFTHVFVVGDRGELAGQVSMVDLAMSSDRTSIRSLTAPVAASVSVETPREECARLHRHYNLTQLPVLEEGHLIGVIPSEYLLSASIEEDTQEMLKVASVPGDSADGPMLASIRSRLPWLTINLATTFLAAFTVSLFESTLARVVVLAAFLPVVAGQGGIGGTQTLTLIVRAIALGELVGVKATRLLTRELALGLFHGVWLGILVASIAALWQQNLGLALVLGVAMLGNMAVAGVVGAGVPLLLRRIGVDPAVASAVVVTTATDVCGFLLFLGVATAAINLIV